MANKIRLDELVVQQSLAPDKPTAARLIMAGEVRTGDRLWSKAGEKVPIDTLLERKNKKCKWVSKGGVKLEKALKDFRINPQKKKCIDIGASTGGFTDVLIQNGAERVVAVDTGYGKLHMKLRENPRVQLVERTNFRTSYMDFDAESFDLAVTDVSFISLKLIMPGIARIVKEKGIVVALIKPQFEAPVEDVPKGGVVRDVNTQIEVICNLADNASEQGVYLHDLSPIPIIDSKKNLEFLSLWKKTPGKIDSTFIVTKVRQANAQR